MEAGNGYPANSPPGRNRRRTSTGFNGGREWLPGKPPLAAGRGSAAICFNGGREWLPGKPTDRSRRLQPDRTLQWRPGMVTRQTPCRCCPAAAAEGASMEAGNGYPANPFPRLPRCPLLPRFNGGREWLPGKPVPPAAPLPAAALQWRPGMVTRQTRSPGCPAARCCPASMEAGNGYPANRSHFFIPLTCGLGCACERSGKLALERASYSVVKGRYAKPRNAASATQGARCHCSARIRR